MSLKPTSSVQFSASIRRRYLFIYSFLDDNTEILPITTTSEKDHIEKDVLKIIMYINRTA